MKYRLHTFCSVLLFLCSCCGISSNDSSIYWTQQDVKDAFVLQRPLQESDDKHCCPLKGEMLGLPARNNLKSIVVKERSTKNGYTYKLLYSTIVGENDIPIKLSILHIYKGGELVDCIMLSLDFVFEVEHFARFTVTESRISIDRYEINHLIYDEDSGNIIGEKSIPDTTIYHSLYNINHGRITKQP